MRYGYDDQGYSSAPFQSRIERFSEGLRVRFSEKDFLHVVVMKLVQLTSNLRAGRRLIDHGFVYEWGVMKRLLLETVDHILFLLYVERDSSKLKKYLCNFYTEDTDEEGNWQRPDQFVSQGEVRKEVLKKLKEDINGLEAGPLGINMKGIYDLGSGYIHGRVSAIMSLYDLGKNRFRTNGWDNKELLALNLKDFYTVAFSASIGSCGIREKLLMDQEHMPVAMAFGKIIAEITGLQNDIK